MTETSSLNSVLRSSNVLNVKVNVEKKITRPTRRGIREGRSSPIGPIKPLFSTRTPLRILLSADIIHCLSLFYVICTNPNYSRLHKALTGRSSRPLQVRAHSRDLVLVGLCKFLPERLHYLYSHSRHNSGKKEIFPLLS